MSKKTLLLAALALLIGGCASVEEVKFDAPGSSAMSINGFGAETVGGKGGRVITVTNLNGAGPGSFRNAAEAEGPRIIVFEVGGVIDLAKDDIEITSPYLTIAGETAPSPGITLIRGGIQVETHDVIVRHMRVRVGDGGELKEPVWEDDGMCARGPNTYNVLFDHCSVAWAVDEGLSISGPRVKNGTAKSCTIRNSIIAESLDDSTHPKGQHSKGTLVHDFVKDVALLGNFYAHNINRHPYVKPNATIFMANNLIYDPGDKATHFAMPKNEYVNIPDPMLPGEVTAYGNVLRHGAYTPKYMPMYFGPGKVYSNDNVAFDRKGNRERILHNPEVMLQDYPMITVNNFLPLDSSMTEAYVLKNAGARPKDRDEVDIRIINDYINRTGGIIDSQEEVGGYPVVEPTRRKLDVPEGAEAVEMWLKQYRDEVEFLD